MGMIVSDTAIGFPQMGIEPPGDGAWIAQLIVRVAFGEGDWIHAHGKIQFKSAEDYAVECRIGLFFEPGWVLAADRLPGKPAVGILHPITGANIHPEVGDKYLVLSEQVYFQPPGTTGYVVLRVSARSTRAVPGSRVSFGNGLLQARVL
jgi:hypothetical protein